LSQNTEAELVASAVREIRAGNHRAYGQVVECFQRRLFGLAHLITRDETAAEEVTQDAFVRAFSSLEQYDVERPFYPWVSAIVARLAQNWLRAQRRRNAQDVSDLLRAKEGIADDPLNRMVIEERLHLLMAPVALSPVHTTPGG
jgi:RNA polymerase sigma-70 factor (ECF subfamily)